MKLSKKILIFAILAIAVILCIIFSITLPKNEKIHQPELTISAQDTTIKINEECNLEYSVSLPYAVVSFSIENKNIVSSNGFVLKGLSVGQTNISLIAKYQDKTAKCFCVITVISNSSTSNDEENNPPSSDTKNDNPSTQPTLEQPDIPEQKISFSLINQKGCLIKQNSIYIDANTICYFRISFEENILDYSLKPTDGISLTKLEIGLNTWKIISTSPGTIEIIENNSTIGEIFICFN